jgi:hypothetical protein
LIVEVSDYKGGWWRRRESNPPPPLDFAGLFWCFGGCREAAAAFAELDQVLELFVKVRFAF